MGAQTLAGSNAFANIKFLEFKNPATSLPKPQLYLQEELLRGALSEVTGQNGIREDGMLHHLDLVALLFL